MGFRYDSSGNGDQVWPEKKDGLWDLPLQQVPVPGRDFETLSMDYNFLVNQSGTSSGDPSQARVLGRPDARRPAAGLRPRLQRQPRAADHRQPLRVLERRHLHGRRRGRHRRRSARKREVRCVSFRQLADWLDAQDPRGAREAAHPARSARRPKGGWSDVPPAEPDDRAGASRAPGRRPRDRPRAAGAGASGCPGGCTVGGRPPASRGLRRRLLAQHEVGVDLGGQVGTRSCALPQLSAFLRWKCTICRV